MKKGIRPGPFTHLLRRELILEDLSFTSREELLSFMAGRLVSEGYCRSGFVQAILEREAHHPSGLPMPGRKIAIPHADAAYVRRPAILFARLSSPVQFRSMGDPETLLDVEMVSMLALNGETRIGDLLEVLLTVYQDSALLDLLAESEGPKEIYEVLKRHVEIASRN